MRPRYLLLDEPTAGLDAGACDSVLAVIDAVRAHAGVVVVTHDPDRFVASASAVLVLRDARPVFAGDVPAFLDALPALFADGLAEPPQIPGALMLARSRGADASAPLTLDADAAARILVSALKQGGAR
jgi:energy-coupling factor transport system ATP-binding protein